VPDLLSALPTADLARLRADLLRYSEDEARDDRGRWTADGGSVDVGPGFRTSGVPREYGDRVLSTVGRLSAQFPGVRIAVDARTGDDFRATSTGRDKPGTVTIARCEGNALRGQTIVLNGGQVSLDDVNPLTAVPGPEGVAAHEFGHAVDAYMMTAGAGLKDLGGDAMRDYLDWRQRLLSTQGIRGFGSSYLTGRLDASGRYERVRLGWSKLSWYAGTDPREAVAEAFSAAYTPGSPGYDHPACAELRDVLARAGSAASASGKAVKFDDSEERVPAGSPNGGQWTSGGEALASEAAAYEARWPNKAVLDTVPEGLTPEQTALLASLGLDKPQPAIQPDFAAIADPHHGLEAVRELARLREAFPSIRVSSLEMRMPSTLINSSPSDDQRVVARTVIDSIVLNPNWYGKDGPSLDQFSDGAKYHPDGCGTPAGCITHEFGHVLDHALEYDQTAAGEAYRQWRSDYLSSGTRISAYARTNEWEAIAEVFSAAYAPGSLATGNWGAVGLRDVLSSTGVYTGKAATADLAKWNPDQPRVPAGEPGGGQWEGGSPVAGAFRSALDGMPRPSGSIAAQVAFHDWFKQASGGDGQWDVSALSRQPDTGRFSASMAVLSASFPDVTGGVGVKVTDGYAIHAGVGTDAVAWADSLAYPQTVTLEKMMWATGATRLQWGDEASNGFHPEGCWAPEGVAAHEFGHLVDAVLRDTADDERVADLNAFLLTHTASGYGARSGTENFAEWFAAAYSPTSPLAGSADCRDFRAIVESSMVRKYDASEARDERGRWTAGGGGLDGLTLRLDGVHPDIRPGLESTLARMADRYPVLRERGLIVNRLPTIGGALADTAYPMPQTFYKASINLSSAYERPGDPRWAEEPGWSVSQGPEGTLVHEIGHALDMYNGGAGARALEASGPSRGAYGGTRYGTAASLYGATGGPDERFAEAFAQVNLAPESEWSPDARIVAALYPPVTKAAAPDLTKSLRFLDRARSILRAGFLAALVGGARDAAAEAGEDPDLWGEGDFGDEADALVEGQHHWIAGLASVLALGQLTEGMLSSRAGLYASGMYGAYESGFADGVGASRPGWTATWRTEGDKEVCELCADRDGASWPADGSYPLPGEGGFGDQCDGGPNCRCAVDYTYDGDAAQAPDAPEEPLDVAAAATADLLKLRDGAMWDEYWNSRSPAKVADPDWTELPTPTLLRVAAVLRKYSEDQPRVPAGSAEGGEFASAGGESAHLAAMSRMDAAGVAAYVEAHTGTRVDYSRTDNYGHAIPDAKPKMSWLRPAMARFVALHEQFPGVTVTKIGFGTASGKNAGSVLAFCTRDPWNGTSEITLVTTYWAGHWGINMAEGWNAAGPSPEAIMTHEFGHAVDAAAFRAADQQTVYPDSDLGWRLNTFMKAPAISGYGRSDDSDLRKEKFAELFAAVYAPTGNPPADQEAGLRAYLAAALGTAKAALVG